MEHKDKENFKMKRKSCIAAAAAALALAVLLAVPADRASAESPVTFSGYLRFRTLALGGFFPSNADQDKRGDRYAVSRLRLNVVFKPTDNVEVRWRFHGPHAARWGSTNTGAQGDFSLYSIYFYGYIKTDWGNFSVGRVSSDIDSAGLRTLGYAPVWGFNSQGYIFDRDTENDGVMYRKEWDNGFGLKAFYVKRAHRAPYTAGTPASFYYKDADYDRFSLEPYYTWEKGGVSLALQYDRNMYDFTYGTNISAGNFDPDVEQNYAVTLNPAFMHTFDLGGDKTLAIHAEAKYAFGKRREKPAVAGQEPEEHHQDGFGAYLDLTLGYPAGDVALAGWYFSGHDDGAVPGRNNRNYKLHNLVNGGEGFYPFFLFNYGNSFMSAGGVRNLEGNQAPGHWALAVMGHHKINEFVSLDYALGTFRKTADYYLTADRKTSRAMGSEADLGITVKILDNLQWQSKFAIFDAGNYYSDRWNRPDFNGTIWGWGNEFLFSF
jgi:hypothetical protein